MQNVCAAIVHGDAFRAVLGTDAQEMLASFAEQFDGFDEDRAFERWWSRTAGAGFIETSVEARIGNGVKSFC
jgi:hypothetical protein